MAEYIEREALIDAMIASYSGDDVDVSWCTDIEDVAETVYCAMKEVVYTVPFADVAPVRHGRWVEYPRPHYFKCSECKYTVPYRKAMWCNGKREYNFCPNCGAKMDGGDDV